MACEVAGFYPDCYDSWSDPYGPYSVDEILTILECPSDPDCLSNPYGANRPYGIFRLINNYAYGNPYSLKSWRNPYATDPPKIYDDECNYRGRFSINRYHSDSISNPFGKYGSVYSTDSIFNQYKKFYIVPSK